MSNKEIERKYLLYSLPNDIEQHPEHKIRQGYINTDSDNEVRIRAKDDAYFLTIKQGSGLSRTEVEITILEDQFKTLWQLTNNKRIEKIRYDYQVGCYLIEIDVYLNGLKPLMVAEVEFNSVEESLDFNVPDFLGFEVTEEKAYKNAALAVYGIPDSYAEYSHR